MRRIAFLAADSQWSRLRMLGEALPAGSQVVVLCDLLGARYPIRETVTALREADASKVVVIGVAALGDYTGIEGKALDGS
jgi:hypothetical protein